MTIDKNLEGAWRICENINGYLETQVYYFYTKKDAIKKFKEYKKLYDLISLKYIIICKWCTLMQNQLKKQFNNNHGNICI
jgi:hypothetical protein